MLIFNLKFINLAMFTLIKKTSWRLWYFKKNIWLKVEVHTIFTYNFHCNMLEIFWEGVIYRYITMQELFLLLDSQYALKRIPVGFIWELTIKLLLTLAWLGPPHHILVNELAEGNWILCCVQVSVYKSGTDNAIKYI